MACQLTSPRVIQKSIETETKKKKPTVFFNLISEMPYYHFCHLIFVRQTNPVTMRERTTQGCEYKEVGIIGDHLRGSLPQQIWICLCV